MLPKYKAVISKEIKDKRDQGLVLIRIYVTWFEKTIFGENSKLLSDLFKYRYAPLFSHLDLVNWQLECSLIFVGKRLWI
jgi:hypothetical protein